MLFPLKRIILRSEPIAEICPMNILASHEARLKKLGYRKTYLIDNPIYPKLFKVKFPKNIDPNLVDINQLNALEFGLNNISPKEKFFPDFLRFWGDLPLLQNLGIWFSGNTNGEANGLGCTVIPIEKSRDNNLSDQFLGHVELIRVSWYVQNRQRICQERASINIHFLPKPEFLKECWDEIKTEILSTMRMPNFDGSKWLTTAISKNSYLLQPYVIFRFELDYEGNEIIVADSVCLDGGWHMRASGCYDPMSQIKKSDVASKEETVNEWLDKLHFLVNSNTLTLNDFSDAQVWFLEKVEEFLSKSHKHLFKKNQRPIYWKEE